MIGEHGRAGGPAFRAMQQFAQACTEKDVVTQDKRSRFVSEEISTDQKGLRQSLRARLYSVADLQPELRSVLEQAAIIIEILG
jgi:hypothetical protein